MKISSEWESTGALPKQLLCNEYLYSTYKLSKKKTFCKAGILQHDLALLNAILRLNYMIMLVLNMLLLLLVVIETQHIIKLETLIKHNM